MLNKAYIHELFPDTYVMSGIQFMPFQASLDVEVERIINIIGLAVFPACMAIALPVFLYNLVLEKETKLLETMKINGMKMKYYWLINFSFFLGIFLVTVVVFWCVSRKFILLQRHFTVRPLRKKSVVLHQYLNFRIRHCDNALFFIDRSF